MERALPCSLALHSAISKAQLLEWVVPSESQTGEYSRVQDRSHESVGVPADGELRIFIRQKFGQSMVLDLPPPPRGIRTAFHFLKSSFYHFGIQFKFINVLFGNYKVLK